jgi:endonuclease YncB( thermonuclease family)
MAQNDPWAAFSDAPAAAPVRSAQPVPVKPADPWGDFADAPGHGGTAGHSTPSVAALARSLINDRLTGSVIDGDTYNLQSGNHLRLYGADAPESKQMGLPRLGDPIPVGQRAADFARGLLAQQPTTIGGMVSASYGRPVAPVAAAGQDVAQALIRAGQALATPKYLAADPDRQFQYMQAERLARQNRLGLHGLAMQTPEDFRKNPLPLPKRETIPGFWDVPTPDAGLRPDVEKQVLDMVYRSDTPFEQIAAYGKQNGAIIDVASMKAARDYFRKYGAAAGIQYQKPPKVLTDNGDGTAGAVGRGFANGVLPNLLEETGAVADTLGATSGRENVFNSDRRLADIWANNEAQNEAITGFDRQAHPYATTGAEIAGGLVVPMGKVRSAADLAKFGAGYGFASGFGREGTLPKRLTSGVVGAGEGAAVTVLGGKALEAAAPLLAKGWRSVRGEKGPMLVPPAGGPVGVPDTAAAPRTPDGLEMPPAGPVAAPEAGQPVGAGDVGPVQGVGSPGGNSEAPRNLWDLPDAERNAILRDAEKVQEPLMFDHGVNDWRSEMPAEKAARHAEIDRRYAADAVRLLNSQGMAAEPMPSVSQDVPCSPDYLFAQRPGRMDAPRTDAQMRAADIQPGDVVPLPSNVVGSVEEAAAIDKGRYGPATALNERGELKRQTLRTWGGAEVPKTGPVDLVGWLRLNGGLKDQGGELAHMGLTNKGRAGMDFVGQETRFGPLVNSESGMNLDDAAQRAWDAGYFPDHAERPDVNAFLNAVRGTQEGWKRHYLPDDFAEIDRFNAARAERQDLARQRSEVGQVWRDKSMPADEPQPFAPPEAYEEWPSGGPDFAGNINLGKLDTPQDIRRALDQVNNRVGGFDEATRGRVAQAETERLASELGMTPDSLIARRKGQAFNAEEALAARQILAKSGNELVNAAKRIKATENPGDELLADFQRKLARHVAIQEQVSGMTAEAGRTLQQFRMVADSRNVRDDVLRSIVDAGGGGKRVQDAANALLDAVEGEPGKFNVLAEKLTKPRWIDRAIELRYFMLLSGPQTHMSNVVSNTMTALGQFPEHAVAAGLGLGRRAVLGADKAADRVYSSEIGQRAFGFLQGIKEGGAQFLRTLRTGETSDFAGKMEAPMQPAFGGVAGKVIRSPMRMLSAEDEVFKAMARHMEMAGLADRRASMEGLKGKAKADRIAELLNNPPDDMLEKAFDYARYITFQRPLTGIPESLSQLTQKHPLLKFIVPFVRTPTNLMKFAAERSPLAPLLKEWRADVVAGGARRDLALAKAMVGTGFGMWMADLARQGVITGSPPSDKNKERLLRADGWQPYSVKVGNKYVAYNRLDPFSSTISIAADLATKGDGMSERQLEQYPGLLVASIIKSMGDKTWLSGLSDFFEMASDPQRFAPRYLRNQAASSVIPAAPAQLARTIDPVRRDSRSLTDELMARLPGLSQRLPAQTDIWGQPMTTQRLGPDLLSPVITTDRRNDPANAAMLALGSTATAFPKFHMVNGKRVDYTPQEYATLSALAGQKAHDWIAALIKGPGWASKDAGTQAKLFKKSIDTARRDVRAGGGKGLFGRPSLPQAANDPWAAFSDAPVKVK